ncbi:MAG: hypothetical protein AB8H86_27735 [Polyangiales bacterium]
MPDEEKAQSFELAAFRPRFEAVLYALAWALPAGAVLFAMLNESYIAAPFFVAFYFSGFGLHIWTNRIRSTLTMGVDGFSIRRRGKERFVRWTDFVSFDKAPRGLIALTQDGWVPLGRTLVVWDKTIRRHREHKPRETLKLLEEAAKHWRQERAKPRILQLLEGHDEAQWPAVLKKAAQSDFRTSGITQMHLVEDLLNPETPPVLREVLVKTLKFRIEEDVVEDALETFASERSMKALRSAIAKGE